MKIIIVGDSPFTFFLARELDKDLARHAHLDVTLLTREESLTSLLDHRGGTAWQTVDKAKALDHVSLQIGAVKSVSLKQKRVTTAKNLVPYDILVLDQTPCYTAKELMKIESTIQKLILAVRSKPANRAVINFKGEDSSTWQLALTTKSWLTKQRVRNVAVAIPLTTNAKLNDYLKNNGLMLKPTKGPGVSIASPGLVLDTKKVKGIVADELGYALTDAKAFPKGYRDVLVRDGEVLRSVGLWRTDLTRAKLFASQIARLVEGEPSKNLEIETAAVVLLGSNGALTAVGKSLEQGLRAKAIIALELRMRRELFRRYH